MFTILSELVLFFMIIQVSECQRRIVDGEEVVVDKKYVVYLVKAAISERAYDYWLCGGAIVSSEFVITSAACVNDVDYLYVIAGYKKYVIDSEIDYDKCTSQKKKKVIYTCSPKGYELKYGELDYWSYVDIALVRVESPFDFNDDSYETLCSYKPTTIAVNYEEKYQEPGTDALVLGWGHTEGWRKPKDTNNYNQEILRYAPTLLLNKTVCMEHYEDYTNMSEVIKTYMICSLGKGNIDDSGNTIVKSPPIENGCTTQQQKVLGFEGVSCEPKSTEESIEDDTRRHMNFFNKTYNNESLSDINDTYDSNFIDDGRRSGICQNDHGGPLVTWAGSHEILIGIASVFKVSDQSECMGPYLYTSTLCTGLFIDCILTTEGLPDIQAKGDSRRDLCDKPPSERGYDTIERYISWKDHPAGPADNERIGRSGDVKKFPASPKLSASKNQEPKASYAANAKYQEDIKYQSNEMYSANKNPALHESYALQEKYPGNERYPGKDRYQGNERYPTNERYPATKRYPINEGYPISERYPANERYSGKDRYQENAMLDTLHFPGTYLFPTNERYPATKMYPTNERYPATKLYPTNDRYPATKMYPTNERYPATKLYPINEGYPATKRYPENEGYPATKMYPINEGYPASKRYPINEGYPATKRYPINERYRGGGGNPVNLAPPKIALTTKVIAVRPQRPLGN